MILWKVSLSYNDEAMENAGDMGDGERRRRRGSVKIGDVVEIFLRRVGRECGRRFPYG
jgi:hypothetical protein